MRVFLTGSTGFVGSHVARAYAAAGAELRLLTRSTSKLAAIEGMASEIVVGDLRRPEALRTALRGCEVLVHVAADYRLWVRNPQEMYAANVDGTREQSPAGCRDARRPALTEPSCRWPRSPAPSPFAAI